MNTFPSVIEKHFLVSSVISASGQRTVDLTPYQLGLFENTYRKSVGGSLPSSVLLAVGSSHIGQAKTGGKLGAYTNVQSVDMSHKSPVIDTRATKVISTKHVLATTTNQQQIGYLGFDGLHPCNSMQFECGKTYYVEVEVSGQPVRSMFGQDLCKTYTVTTDCCDVCATGCTTAEMKQAYLDKLIFQLNENDPFLNRFVKFHKIIKYCVPETPPTKTTYTKYCTSMCDGGSSIDLAKMQAFYPSVTITKTKREDGISYYETDYVTTGVPATYVKSSFVLQNCAVCPATTTAVAGVSQLLVTIDNAGTDILPATQLAAVQLVIPTATKATKTSFENGTGTYLVEVPAGYVVPTFPADTTIELLGTSVGYCIVPTTSYTWTACGTCYKIKRTLQTVIQNPNCNPGQVLTDLIAYYANDPTIVAGSIVAAPVVAGMIGNQVTTATDNCKTTYQLEQWSECMADGCDWIDVASFKGVQAWNGFLWSPQICTGWTINAGGCPVPPVVATEDFVAGIKYEIIYDETLDADCAYSLYDGLSKEPIFVKMTFGEWGNTQVCKANYNVPFKITQHFSKESGRGHEVMKNIIQTQYNEGNLYTDSVAENAHKFNKANGLEWGIEPNHYYNYVELIFDSVQADRYYMSDTGRRFKYTFWYDQNDVLVGKDLVKMVNKIAIKADLPAIV